MKVLCGAVVPLAVVLLYAYWIGALADLWAWAVVYNLKVYAPETAKGIGATAGLLWRVLVRVFRFDLVVVALSVAGLVLFGIERIKARITNGKAFNSPCFVKEAIVILPLFYLIFCIINFQSGPDLIPLFPFMGLFAGWFIVKTAERGSGRGLARTLPSAALLILFALITIRSLTYKVEADLTLQDQQKEFREVMRSPCAGWPDLRSRER